MFNGHFVAKSKPTCKHLMARCWSSCVASWYTAAGREKECPARSKSTTPVRSMSWMTFRKGSNGPSFPSASFWVLNAEPHIFFGVWETHPQTHVINHIILNAVKQWTFKPSGLQNNLVPIMLELEDVGLVRVLLEQQLEAQNWSDMKRSLKKCFKKQGVHEGCNFLKNFIG